MNTGAEDYLCIIGLMLCWWLMRASWQSREAVKVLGKNPRLLPFIYAAMMRQCVKGTVYVGILVQGLDPLHFNSRTSVVFLLAGQIALSLIDVLMLYGAADTKDNYDDNH